VAPNSPKRARAILSDPNHVATTAPAMPSAEVPAPWTGRRRIRPRVRSCPARWCRRDLRRTPPVFGKVPVAGPGTGPETTITEDAMAPTEPAEAKARTGATRRRAEARSCHASHGLPLER
jgi:hypothetical protein